MKRYLISSATTFLATFFGSLALQLQNGTGIYFTGAFLLSLLAIAARAGVKAAVESWVGNHADL